MITNNKKILIILGLVIIVLFIGLGFQYQADSDIYSGQITDEQLKQQLRQNEVYIYYFQPNCSHCEKVSPILIPLAEKMGVNFYPIDIAKYQSMWKEFRIKGTPTVIHFKDGEEVNRIVGEHSEEAFHKFFSR